MTDSTQTGQAALLIVILVLAFSTVAVMGINLIAVQRQVTARSQIDAFQSYYVAESGIEDSLLRITNPNYTSQDSTTLTLNGSTATITIDQADDTKTVTSVGDVRNQIRKITTSLTENSIGASFFYGIQVDDGGLTMNNNSRVNGHVYSNSNITGSNGATITGDVVVSGGLDNAPGVEWTAHNADHFFATTSSNRDIAQSFTANETGPMPQVAVYLGKVGNPASNITLRITADASGKPATSSLANQAIPYASVSTTPGWITVGFSSPPNLTNGSKYWIVLDYGSNSAANYWNWRKDSGGGYANNTGSTTANWSAGGAVWAGVGGDLTFQAWIGGETKKVEGLTIGSSTSGTGRANRFVTTSIHGSACPNQYCIVENPARQELPIPADIIQTWKDDATAGGVVAGDYTLSNGATASLGAKKITGDLTLDNGAILTLTGTVWVEGDIQLSNNCHVQLDESYGGASGVLLTSGVVQVSNNCTFDGSGEANSYIMLLADKDAPTENVMNISNNALGVIYYAPRGRLHFSNNAAAKEATAYGITLDNNATITYESGLQSLYFSSGPSGGWTFGPWQETN